MDDAELVGGVLLDAADPNAAARALAELLTNGTTDRAAARAAGLDPDLVAVLANRFRTDHARIQNACSLGTAWVAGRKSVTVDEPWNSSPHYLPAPRYPRAYVTRPPRRSSSSSPRHRARSGSWHRSSTGSASHSSPTQSQPRPLAASLSKSFFQRVPHMPAQPWRSSRTRSDARATSRDTRSPPSAPSPLGAPQGDLLRLSRRIHRKCERNWSGHQRPQPRARHPRPRTRGGSRRTADRHLRGMI